MLDVSAVVTMLVCCVNSMVAQMMIQYLCSDNVEANLYLIFLTPDVHATRSFILSYAPNVFKIQ